jgi:hypothetical protein
MRAGLRHTACEKEEIQSAHAAERLSPFNTRTAGGSIVPAGVLGAGQLAVDSPFQAVGNDVRKIAQGGHELLGRDGHPL